MARSTARMLVSRSSLRCRLGLLARLLLQIVAQRPWARVRAPDLALIGDPGLVAPVDYRALGFGALRDRR
jgi:hypothetical protein